MGPAGIEPASFRLKGGYSTVEFRTLYFLAATSGVFLRFMISLESLSFQFAEFGEAWKESNLSGGATRFTAALGLPDR